MTEPRDPAGLLREALTEIAEADGRAGSWDGWREVGRLRDIARAALAATGDSEARDADWRPVDPAEAEHWQSATGGSEGPLDVERLAIAMSYAMQWAMAGTRTPGPQAMKTAATVAREYARLSSKEAGG